jgi:amino acid permease
MVVMIAISTYSLVVEAPLYVSELPEPEMTILDQIYSILPFMVDVLAFQTVLPTLVTSLDDKSKKNIDYILMYSCILIVSIESMFAILIGSSIGTRNIP